MKPDLSPLEKRLSRPEARLPSGLRQRSLQRLGLRAPARFSPRQRWALSGVSLLAAGLIVWCAAPSRLGPKPALLTAKLPASSVPAPKSSLSATAPDPAPAPKRPAVEPAVPVDEGSLAGVASSTAPATGSTLGQAAPASSQQMGSSLESPGGPATAARAGASAKQPAAEGYSFAVRGNRIRPGFGERLHLELRTGKPGAVRAAAYDERGRQVRQLADLGDPQGLIAIEWDGRMDDGQNAPSGAYLVIVQGPDKTEKVSVLVIR